MPCVHFASAADARVVSMEDSGRPIEPRPGEPTGPRSVGLAFTERDRHSIGATYPVSPPSKIGSPMSETIKTLTLASALFIAANLSSALGAEREQVRMVINLITGVKMPFPENLRNNLAHTERVQLDTNGATVACLRLDDKIRWCYDYIAPIGARAEMLRIRNEPEGGISIGALYYYVVDYDLDGTIDVGSTTQIEALDRENRTPIAHIIEFFSRSTKRGEPYQAKFQKMYDDGIQIALKYFGE
jgi:hypothetical protein